MATKHKSEAREKLRREKMCENKTAFKTKELAFQEGQRNYKCEYCGLWHRSGQFSEFLKDVKKGKYKVGSSKKKKKSKGKFEGSIIIKGKKIKIKKLH